MVKHRIDATEALTHLREGTPQYALFIEVIRTGARSGNFSLVEIGTSEDELEELRVKGCKIAAMKYLNCLRHGTEQYNVFIGALRTEARSGNFSLVEIGTSEDELEELRVKGCKIAAIKWLSCLRFTARKYHLFVIALRAEARMGSFSLEEIGTSEDELEELRVKVGA